MTTTIQVTFQNFSTSAITVSQNGVVVGTVTAGAETWPAIQQFSLSGSGESVAVGSENVFILYSGSYVVVDTGGSVTVNPPVTPVRVSPNHFRALEFDPLGNPTGRFMVQGVAVAAKTETEDVLEDARHDYFRENILPALVYLKANTIRVYQIHSGLSHARTMNLLAANGIYVMASLVTEGVGIESLKPQYTYQIYMHGKTIIDEFQAYTNTLAFLTSNELINPVYLAANSKHPRKDEAACAVADKSFMRDMKIYMSGRKYRQIPVGAALVDVMGSATPDGLIGTRSVGEFYAWEDSDGVCADFIGLNSYRYITESVTPLNSYDHLASQMAALSCPFILTESGGQQQPAVARDWKIVPQMYTEPKLSELFSGQVAFQLFEMGGQDQGLYVKSDTAPLTPTAYGVASGLSQQFGIAATDTAGMGWPANVPATPQPADFTPAPSLLPKFSPPSASVTFSNTSQHTVDVVQGNWVAATLAPQTQATVLICPDLEVFMLAPNQNWEMVCSVPAKTLASGYTVTDSVTWGGACPLTLPG